MLKSSMKSLVVFLLAVTVFACKKNSTLTKLATVTTTAATNISSNGATTGGTIVSDGGAAITASGVCFSKVNNMPNITDDTTKTKVASGSFTCILKSLQSGSTYYIRAYAINSVGIAYGEVITVVTGNAAPSATNVSISGAAEVNSTLTANYTYTDTDGDAESGTAFQWFVADNGAGDGEAPIIGATAKTYVVQQAEFGKYIRVAVTPKAAAGSNTGLEVKSPFVGGIGDATTVTFVYNGSTVTYGIITSSVTGRKWLDRSLGAAGSPTSAENWQNWGHLFQWGRLADGHQVVTRTGPEGPLAGQVIGVDPIGTSDAPAYSNNDVPGHALYIRGTASLQLGPPYDWRKPQNNNLWQGVSGINNPCPAGWKVPSIVDWAAEGMTDGSKTPQQAYAQLKLTYNNSRSLFIGHGFQGGVSADGTSKTGTYWSSTAVPRAGGTEFSSDFIFLKYNSSSGGTVRSIDALVAALEGSAHYHRAFGHEVRCVKN